jgi:hypothetical protein
MPLLCTGLTLLLVGPYKYVTTGPPELPKRKRTDFTPGK